MNGIAVTGLTSGTGTWQYSTDNGSTWTAVGSVSDTWLFSCAPAISSGSFPTARTPRPAASPSAPGTRPAAQPARRPTSAPTAARPPTARPPPPPTSRSTAQRRPRAGGANDFTTISEDQTTNSGDLVATLISGQISDVDAGAVNGIAVTSLTSGTGTWQYSTDNGSTWTAVGSVSDSAALLLRSSDKLRFVPNGQNTTTGSVTFRAWDQTSGTAGTTADVSTNGGTTAYSSATATSNITVTAVNDAPVLAAPTISPRSPKTRPITVATRSPPSSAGRSATWTRRGEWHRRHQPDQRHGHLAILDRQRQHLDECRQRQRHVGLALRSSDKLRFVPDGQNATSGAVTFRAWDQTSGTAGTTADVSTNGGTTAFSSATATVQHHRHSTNDAPVLAAPASVTTDEDVTITLSAANGNGITLCDCDVGGANMTLTLSVVHGTLTLSQSIGLTVVAGANNTATITVSGTFHLNAALDGLQYRSTSHYNGSDSINVVIRDGGNTGSGGELSSSADIGVTINPVNQAPQAGPASFTTNNDVLMVVPSTALLAGCTDIDDDPLQVILITGPGARYPHHAE